MKIKHKKFDDAIRQSERRTFIQTKDFTESFFKWANFFEIKVNPSENRFFRRFIVWFCRSYRILFCIDLPK